MKHEIPCSVILDLLPLYTEGLLRAENEQAVRLHTQACPTCRRALLEMQNGTPAMQEPAGQALHLQEVKPLKKLRRRFWLNLLTSPLWIPLALVAFSLSLVLLALLFTLWLLLWCFPVILGACTLAAIALLLQSILLSLGVNALLAVGIFSAALGGTLLTIPLCVQCSRLLFSGLSALTRKLFGKKKQTEQKGANRI